MRRTLAVVAAVAATAVASGCGGGSASPPSFATVATTAVAPTTDEPTTLAPTTAAPADSTITTVVVPPAEWAPATSGLVGIPSECGNMSYVVSRPDRDMLIAGIALRGLFASFDGSDEWTPLGQGAGSDPIGNRMSSAVFDPEHPDTFWESGIYLGGGVFRTDDNGTTFRQLGDVTHSDGVSVDLTDPDRRTLLSGTHEATNVYRSGDGGATWQDVSGTLPPDIGFASYPHVIDAQTHLLGTQAGSGSGVFRTTDGGATWTLVHPGGVVGAPIVEGSTMYWLRELGEGVISSTDGGVTWTEVPGNGQIYQYALGLVPVSSGRFAVLGNDHVLVSEDGGTTWTPVGSALPYPPNGLAYSPFRDAFYVWRFDCTFDTDNPIAPDAIMRMDAGLAG